MRAGRSIVGVAVCGLFVAASLPSVAAEPCAAARSANNPAFGTPQACATRAGAAAAVERTNPPRAATVTRSGGKTIYRTDDTTVEVGGHVAADVVVGRGRMRP